jgi:hypothetical protein
VNRDDFWLVDVQSNPYAKFPAIDWKGWLEKEALWLSYVMGMDGALCPCVVFSSLDLHLIPVLVLSNIEPSFSVLGNASTGIRETKTKPSIQQGGGGWCWRSTDLLAILESYDR